MNIFDYVQYSEENGLVWKKRTSARSRSKPGSACGCLNKNGYITMFFNKKNYRVHRLVWELFNGPIPDGMEVDHINHVRSDNRIENLRIVTRKDNAKNQSLFSNNSSGRCGVYWHKPLSKWCARIKIDGKLIHIGYYARFEDAEKARKEAETDLNFHKNHGK